MSTSETRTAPWVIYPFLLAVHFVLFLYAFNVDETLASHIVAPLLGSVVLAGIAWVLGRALLREPLKAGVFAGALVLLFGVYGRLSGELFLFLMSRRAGPGDGITNGTITHVLLSAAWVAILAGLWLWLRSRSRSLIPTTAAFNVMAFILVALDLVVAGRGLLTSAAVDMAEPVVDSAAVASVDSPDIYYVILDGYGRQDVLQEHFGYDNSEFVEFLQDRGFHVAPRSRSNYQWTALSLASTLNMRHLFDVAEAMGVRSRDESPVYRLVRRSHVARFLQSRGYAFVHFASTIGPTMAAMEADVVVDCGGPLFRTAFSRSLAQSTWLSVLEPLLGQDLARCHLGQFQRLEAIASTPGPKFVMAHFIPPHYPYLFDAQGNVLRHVTIRNQAKFQKKLWGDKEAYVQQVQFVNTKIKAVVDSILKGSNREPVIIIQSDHGPQLLDVDRGLYNHARFATLSAFYLPEGDAEEVFGPEPSPVNQFGILFRRYFDTEFPERPTASFYSLYSRPYDFWQVNFPEGTLEPVPFANRIQ